MNVVDCGNKTAYQTPGRDEPVKGLILHATAGTASFDHRIFMGQEPDYPVSIHYYVLKTGEIRYYVRAHDTAWHCGDSEFNGYTDFACNEITIGTELENLNTGNDPYPTEQFDAAVELWRTLIQQSGITREWCARHSDIAPGRKSDPKGFPWDQFLDACYGAPVSYERRYRVLYNRSVVRQGPATSYPVVTYLNEGQEFWADSIKFGEPVKTGDRGINKNGNWLHLSDGTGFITQTAVKRVDV